MAKAAQLLPVEVGTRLKLVTEFTPDLAGVRTAIGGGPLLATQGESLKRRSKDPRNPRTAIGWNDKEFFFVVVDGRSKELSIGVGFAELADLMVELGCKEALNLDGGGSSTMIVGNDTVNHPSDPTGERADSDALLVFARPGH